MTASTTRRAGAARSRLAAVAAIAVTGSLLLSGCGDQRDKISNNSTSGAPLFGLLPKEIQSSKVIEVGSDISYPPVEFRKSGRVIGLDIDLADAMGKHLGVKMKFSNGDFDGLITGLKSKRFDIAMSAMTDNKGRQEGVDPDSGKKVGEGVDFVDYLTAGVSIYTRKGDDQGITTWDDLCGKKIAVQRATVSHDLAKAQSKECGDKGKIEIEAFAKDTEAQVRLKGGGADAASSDFPVAAYAVRTSGGGEDFQLVGDQVDAAPYGIAVGKKNTQLRDALKAALDAVIRTGEYQKILEKWGAEDGAVDQAIVNGGK
ncbi:ABC transporter substrate-binding protein [Streptomyces sp. XD-27]|uniref:ABC transporter substrate-binding protein n=1 Tax=Streptomyces sp. XD-27 TaxID=3062779 RepID=UPI0026F422E1|nr:ABC transporter substrate-binding protein [Streptomyces sp. XD-27]WKX72530.1 ABC transporter substrate-binding protein [Streptomyces sp. XD-27]